MTVGIRARSEGGAGAGLFPDGIGFYIQRHTRAFPCGKIAALTVVVLVMVIAIEQLSLWIRRRLR